MLKQALLWCIRLISCLTGADVRGDANTRSHATGTMPEKGKLVILLKYLEGRCQH